MHGLDKNMASYKNLLNLSPQIILITDLSGYIIMANDMAARFLGRSPDEFTGLNIRHIDVTLATSGWLDKIKSLEASPVKMKTRYIRKDNSSIAVSVSCSKIRLDENDYICFSTKPSSDKPLFDSRRYTKSEKPRQ